MKAHAIVYGPNNQGVTLQTDGGHTSLAIFHDYGEAVSVLSEMPNKSEYRIIEVGILQA